MQVKGSDLVENDYFRIKGSMGTKKRRTVAKVIAGIPKRAQIMDSPGENTFTNKFITIEPNASYEKVHVR